MPRQFRPVVRSSVLPPVCLSVTCAICVKTAEPVIEILSLSNRPIIIVFRHQGLLRKSDGFTTNAGSKYNGVAIFDQYAAISETVIVRGTYTIEDEYKVICALSNSATFDDQFQGHSIV